MTHALRFEPPSIKRRGELVRLRAAAQQQKPEHGEVKGKLRCVCGATLPFTIMSNGISWGRCSAACGVTWSQ